jgi:hypothetical protein
LKKSFVIYFTGALASNLNGYFGEMDEWN